MLPSCTLMTVRLMYAGCTVDSSNSNGTRFPPRPVVELVRAGIMLGTENLPTILFLAWVESVYVVE